MVESWFWFYLEIFVHIWCPSSLLLGGFALGVDFGYLGGVLLQVGDLVHDALVLGGACLWSVTIGGWWSLVGDLMDVLLGWWFDGGFALMTWSLGWWWIFFGDAFGGLGGICFGCFGDWFCFADNGRGLRIGDYWRGWTMWRDRDDDQTNAVGVAVMVFSYSSMQAGSCTLWELDLSNPSWLNPKNTSWA